VRAVFLAIALPLLLPAAPKSILIQAESMPYGGDWKPTTETKALGRRALICQDPEGKMPAVGFVAVPEAGTWQLWVRAKDFPQDRPGTRTFTVEINGQRSSEIFGAHGVGDPQQPEWLWQSGGEFRLDAGPALLALIPLTPWCRADAIALVPAGEKVPASAQAVQDATVVPAATAPGSALEAVGKAGSPWSAHDTGVVVAKLEDQDTAMVFTQGSLGNRPVVMLRVDRRRDGNWTTVLGPRIEGYDLLVGEEDLTIASRQAGILVNWDVKGGIRTVSLGAARYQTRVASATSDPESCGTMIPCLPTTCERIGEAVVLKASVPEGMVEARWELSEKDGFPVLTTRLTVSDEGWYGLRYTACAPVKREEVEEITCPYLFNYRRLPTAPELIPTEETSTPMATVQTAGPRTVGLAFDPDDLPTAWPDCAQFEAGFQLVDTDGNAQPSAWLLIPAGQGSRLLPDETVTRRVRLIAENTDWLGAYRKVAENLCELRDYRRNHEQSLTQTLLNVISLMADDEATGWSKEQLGFWNIESRNAVTHAAPLALVEAALLTGDEDLLARRAAPALAFLLSRPTCHVGADPSIPGRYGRYELGRPTAQYGAAVRLSAWEMTRGYSPAFRALSFDDEGEPARTPAVGTMDDALAAYRATGEKRYLDKAHELALDYAKEYAEQQTVEKPRYAFFQVTHSGNWRGLLAVAEATQDPVLAKASAEIAQRMVAGLYTWPKVVSGPMTIHKGGRTRTNGWCWFKGANLFLLGRDAPEGDHPIHEGFGDLAVPEKQVEGWLPSVVGLGIEQPTTYRRGDGTCAHIIMANWAPHLLRLDTLSPEPLFTTAAHNATLGRWGTYPGYYRTDFTDITRSPDYALKGPDVSGIYWHHIPCFLMMLADYLVTDVEVRSAGAIQFPSARQCGYVWFDNRLFGHLPGTVYGRKEVWPWLPRDLVTVERPELNWLAGHDRENVYLFLTNTTDKPVRSRVKLDTTKLGGALGKVFVRCDGGDETALAAGSDGSIPVSGNGLTVVRFAGLQAQVPLHQRSPRPQDPIAYQAEAQTDTVAGTVRANWIGFGESHAFAHVYSDHQGKQAHRGELVLEQDGQAQTLTRDFWPIEFLAPIQPGKAARLTLTVIDDDGGRHVAPTLELKPPYTR
jgi:hypothetical protein